MAVVRGGVRDADTERGGAYGAAGCDSWSGEDDREASVAQPHTLAQLRLVAACDGGAADTGGDDA